ncbi:hypothetical protein LR48_Vigan05g056300 [Vigna angularis]|uniref:Uncharacterized protein n=1 Tax=Phaseolus angularis TaxID=3914 RepID=A0A0L9UK79_PHAAN|nr:hypothetical protein LR48_Vigan05g056300 [Vigna angularis]
MPLAVQERLSQESGRSPRRQKSGRSSRVEARADARPEWKHERTLVQELEDVRPRLRTLVQSSGRSSKEGGRSSQDSGRSSRQEDARPGGRSSHKRALVQERRTFVQRQRALVQEADARPVRQKWTLVQPGRGRSSKLQKGRSFVQTRGTLVHAEDDARPCRLKDVRPNARGSRSGATFRQFSIFQRVSRPGAKMGRPGVPFQRVSRPGAIDRGRPSATFADVSI